MPSPLTARRALLPLFLLVLVAGRLAAQGPSREAMIASAAGGADRFWKLATTQPTPPDLGARDLFLQTVVLCAAGRDLQRIRTYCELATQMQDRDPQSRGYGNFRWYWRDEKVADYNAVEFSMQSAVLLLLRYGDKIPADARPLFDKLVDLGVEGCLRHRVSPSYTNIALMNASNLILLGEVLGRPKVVAEGMRRLDWVCLEMAEHGIHEYDSPTYYGTDLDDLVLLASFARHERGREQALVLLDLLCTDLACNWFEPAGKLAGTASRDYDYLRGLGFLHTPLWALGWVTDKEFGGRGALHCGLSDWRPAPRYKQLAVERVPRLVRQIWGPAPQHSKTHYVLPDVTLGTSAATYHNMDIPLSFTFAGPREQVRGYFIADGRHDPYGKVRIPEGKGPHSKTLHLLPFWTAAQNRRDALGLVAYRPRDLPAEFTTLESHVVFPKAVDELWVDGARVDLQPKEPRPLRLGSAVVMRKGSAAVGLKVLAARALDGGDAPVTLEDDGNTFGALRLTVAHQAAERKADAAVCLWVRVGSGLDAAGFEAWRRQFVAATGAATLGTDSAEASAVGLDGRVALSVGARWQPTSWEPTPTKAILELDGQDIGAPILDRIEPVRTARLWQQQARPVELAPGRSATFEAESGAIRPMFTVGEDPAASGGKYVWLPGEPGGQGGGSGDVRWALRAAQPLRVWLWAKVQTPTPDDDSVFVRVFTPQRDVLSLAAWHLGVHRAWAWVPFVPEGATAPLALDLPAGEVTLQLSPREDGAKVDALCLATRADEAPR